MNVFLRALRGTIKRIADRLWPLPEITHGLLDDNTLVSLIGRHDPVILDIGCNDGAQTLWFLSLFPDARIFCFEPDPRARARFTSMVDDDRAELSDIAISDVDGTAQFFASGGWPEDTDQGPRPEGWDCSGSIRKPKRHLELHPWCTFDETFEVTTMRLDTWRRSRALERIDFIWADVQGAEADLIHGGRETLSQTRLFYTEYNNDELYEGQIGLRRLLRMMGNCGFELVTRYENDVLLRNRRFR